jgi:uncharacterized protein YfaS (alpha-2-macroglobulin family)
MVGRAFRELGVRNELLEADLPKMVDVGRQKLYGFQHADGGWGWWFDDPSHDYQTAYILFGLAMTRQAGFEIDDGVIERGAEWLHDQLDRTDPRTEAYALFALAMAGYPEPGRAQVLASEVLDGQIKEFDPFSQAALALSLHASGDSATARILVQDLAAGAITQGNRAYWDTGMTDGKYKQKTMASSVRATALALDALVQIEPNHELIPRAVRWLMNQRHGQAWHTTQETSYALLALSDYVISSQSQIAHESYRIDINGQTVAEGAFTEASQAVRVTIPGSQLRAGENVVRLLHGGDTRLYATTWLRAYVAEEALEPAGQITVQRTYTRPGGQTIKGPVQVGDLIEVHLTVDLPQEASYVIVYDPLPAGLEGLNERLATTSYVARDWWEPEPSFGQFPYSRKDVRDDSVALFFTSLSPGKHEFTYLARATLIGTFHALPTEVYPMYEPEVWGRSAGDVIVIQAVTE